MKIFERKHGQQTGRTAALRADDPALPPGAPLPAPRAGPGTHGPIRVTGGEEPDRSPGTAERDTGGLVPDPQRASAPVERSPLGNGAGAGGSGGGASRLSAPDTGTGPGQHRGAVSTGRLGSAGVGSTGFGVSRLGRGGRRAGEDWRGRGGTGPAGCRCGCRFRRAEPAVPAGREPLGALGQRPACKKRRKSRTAFTNQQIYELEQRFLRQKYLSPADRDQLAARLALSTAQVITWFQNRRAKLKRDLEELRADVASLQALPPAALQQLAAMPDPPRPPGPGPGPGPGPSPPAAAAELSEEEIDVGD